MPEEASLDYKLDPRLWTIRLTFYRVFILNELLIQPCHGYELSVTYKVRPKTIYDILGLFEKEGIITHRVVYSSRGMPRKLYFLTDFGRYFAKKRIDEWETNQALEQEQQADQKSRTLS